MRSLNQITRPATLSLALAGIMLCATGCGKLAPAESLQTSATTPPAPVAEKVAAETPKETQSKAIAPSNAWPIFRGNAQSTGVSAASLPDKLSVLWKYDGAGEAGYEASLAISEGVVYAPDLYGTLHALNLSDGKPKWTFSAGEVSGFIGSPAVRGDRVFIGDMDGIVYCLNAENGEKIWEYSTGAEIDSGANFYKDSILIGSQDATLYRLNRDTGELVWKFPIEDQIRCTPTIVENRAFVGGCDGRLHVVDLDKGEAISSVELESQTGVTPAVQGDYAFLGTEGGIFMGVHWRDGEVAWRREDDRMVQPIRSSPAVQGNLVIYGARDKRLHALNVETGNEEWAFAAKGPIDCSPVVVGENVYFGAEDGRLYRVNIKTGKSDWNRQLSGKLKTSSPAVADGRLVIATDHGVVYCLGEKK